MNRYKYSKNIIFSHLNINSIRNKFENLKEVVSNHVDILVISETKIDKSFPTAQFIIDGFHRPLRLDISDKSGGLLVYVRSYLLSRQLTKFEIPSDIQAIPFIIDIIDCFSNGYYNHIVKGDFNLERSQMYLETFMDTPNYFNLVKNKTCFKGPASCIDLILTNRKYCFQGTSSFETD